MNIDIRRIDLNLLVVFDAIFRTRNLTVAGEALALSQPAMSHALRRLRAIVRDPLFVRLPRGLQPTPFAEELSGPIAQALDVLRGALDKAGFVPATSTRTFRIAMTDIGEFVFLPALTQHLGATAPGISIQSIQIPVKELREGMADGAVDLALGFIPQLGAGFYQQRLFRDSYRCMVREGHPKINASLSLKQYREAMHAVVSSEGTGHGELVERVLQRRGIAARIALRVTHFLAIPAIVASTDLVVTLPKNLAESFTPWLKVRSFPVPIELPEFDVKQFWHERFHLEPGNQWLRQTVTALFGSLGAEGPFGTSRHPVRVR